MKAKNLVFIISDEHQACALSCAGHPIVRTPNIDRLAARGTRFTVAYTPCPICVPARASLATGRYVHDTRYWDNAMGYDGRVPGWGARLQAASVRVESIGTPPYRNGREPTGVDEANRRRAISAYYALCTMMDCHIGAICAALEETGAAETTTVIYASDHGEALGERAHWGKSNLYGECTQVPLVMAGPDVAAG